MTQRWSRNYDHCQNPDCPFTKDCITDNTHGENGLCVFCFNKRKETQLKKCDICRRSRPVAVYRNRKPVCESCSGMEPEKNICFICEKHKPVTNWWRHKPICSNCSPKVIYPRQKELCSQCNKMKFMLAKVRSKPICSTCFKSRRKKKKKK